MTPDEVRKRVAEIKEIADDAESAHEAEDRLWEDVLKEVASLATDDHVPECAALAIEALKTKEVRFPRWFA